MDRKATLAINEIRNFYSKNSNPANVEKYSRYFKEGYDAYGISQEQMDELKAVIIEKYMEDDGLDFVFEVSESLFGSGKYEEGSLPIVLAITLKKQLEYDHFDEIEKWFDYGINNWAHVDMMSTHLLPEFFTRCSFPLNRLQPWVKSGLKWKRRASAVTLIKLFDEFKIKEMLKLLSPLMEDEDRPAQQGVGWFLREAWKRDRIQVENFLMEWKNKSPRLIYQYATEKMTMAEKVKFKKDR